MGLGPLHIINSGLIQKLQGAGYTVSHKEIIIEEIFPDTTVRGFLSNGLSKEDLIQTINYCISQIQVASATISSYDPSLDTEGKMLSIINELIQTILKHYFSVSLNQ